MSPVLLQSVMPPLQFDDIYTEIPRLIEKLETNPNLEALEEPIVMRLLQTDSDTSSIRESHRTTDEKTAARILL